MAALVSIARWTQVDLKALAASTQRAQLLTIPYSHYCELARWSLEVAGIDYDEHGYSPGAHVVYGEQRRSDVSVGDRSSNSVPAHERCDLHSRSCVAPGALLSNSDTEHTRCGAHTRFELEVGACTSHSPAAQPA